MDNLSEPIAINKKALEFGLMFAGFLKVSKEYDFDDVGLEPEQRMYD